MTRQKAIIIIPIVSLLAAWTIFVVMLALGGAGWWYLERQHAAEVQQIADKTDTLTAQIETAEEKHAETIADLKDKVAEEFYRGRFELCNDIMAGTSPMFCYSFTANSYEQREHKQPPRPNWDWQRLKIALGEMEYR